MRLPIFVLAKGEGTFKGLRLVSPSKFAVVTKHFPLESEDHKRIASQGTSQSRFIFTSSPGRISRDFTSCKTEFRITKTRTFSQKKICKA